jgi:hypothetical protein
MNGIARQAAFYRGYLPDDRSLLPLTFILSTTVALWLLVYLAGVVADAAQGGGAARVASERFFRDRPTSSSPIHDAVGRPASAVLCLTAKNETATCRTLTPGRHDHARRESGTAQSSPNQRSPIGPFAEPESAASACS